MTDEVKLADQIKALRAKLVAEILRLDGEDMTCREIGKVLGLTRGQVSGIVFSYRTRGKKRGWTARKVVAWAQRRKAPSEPRNEPVSFIVPPTQAQKMGRR